MTISKRNVFYLSGFDPRGARFYYQFYKTGAAKYTQVSGNALEISARRREAQADVRWDVHNLGEGVQTDFCFLSWEDIVRDAWLKNPVTLFIKGLRAYFSYIFTARWPTIFKLPHTPLITFSYPLLSLLIFPLLLLFVFDCMLGVIGLPWLLSLPLAAAGALWCSAWLLKKIKALWLLRFFIFNYEAFTDEHPKMELRLQEFARMIHKSLKAGGVEETLLICHSNGSIMAPSLMKYLLRLQGGEMPANFHLVTLGQCIPLISHLNSAGRYRDILQEVANHDFHWVDSSFPPDGASYCKVDPFLPYFPAHKVRLQLFSPRSFKYYEPENYKRIMRQKYNLHFHYLQSGDSLAPLDFYRMTAGSEPFETLVAEMEAVA